MKNLNPAAIAAKWSNRMAGAGESMKQGVQAVTVAPTQQAAAAKDRWLAGIQRSAAEGTYEEGLNGVTLQDWQRSMLDKGITNMQTGARTSVPKVQKFLTAFLPFAQQVSEEVSQMPKGTIEDSVNRAAAAIRKLATFRKPR